MRPTTRSTIKVIATTDNEDGYLKKSMQPIYAAAAQEMGRSRVDRMTVLHH